MVGNIFHSTDLPRDHSWRRREILTSVAARDKFPTITNSLYSMPQQPEPCSTLSPTLSTSMFYCFCSFPKFGLFPR